MSKRLGAQTVVLPSRPGILAWASTAGQKEKEGPYGEKFDSIIPDELNGQQSFEGAERAMLEETIVRCVQKANKAICDVQMLLCGDLLNQIISAGFAARNLGIPFYGLYGACSTMAESLSVGGKTIPRPAGIGQSANADCAVDGYGSRGGYAGRRRTGEACRRGFNACDLRACD